MYSFKPSIAKMGLWGRETQVMTSVYIVLSWDKNNDIVNYIFQLK